MTHIDMEIDAIKMEAKIDYDWVHADGTEGGKLSVNHTEHSHQPSSKSLIVPVS